MLQEIDEKYLQAYLGAKILTKEDIVGKRQDMGAISVGRLSK